MIKKILTFFLALFVMNVLVSCNTNSKEDNKIDYENIYKNINEKHGQVTNGVYKASYGYIKSYEQGYNNFYYMYSSNKNIKEMKNQNDIWKGIQTTFKEGVFNSVEGENVVLIFDSPLEGNAHLFSNPKIVKGSYGAVRIFLNEKVIYEENVVDEEGVWQSFMVKLKKEDKLKFEVEGKVSVKWNPTIDYNNNSETLLHYTVDGHFGDVHPFWHNGKLYMYYLSTGKQQNSFQELYRSLLVTSDNMIHYEPVELNINTMNKPDTGLYYVLGVYKDKNGVFRSSYGHNGYVGGSKSKDLITWESGYDSIQNPNTGFVDFSFKVNFSSKAKGGGRDPYIFYDKESKKYYCVVINYYEKTLYKGQKGLALYQAEENGIFSPTLTKMKDFTGRGDPECPQILKIGRRWYLFYSVYETGSAGNVGKLAYLVGDLDKQIDQVDWNSKHEYYADGGDLHAAQVCQVGNKYYMYGWINYNPHVKVWGGYLNLAREVFVKDDGTLGFRCDSHLTKLLNKGLIKNIGQEQKRKEVKYENNEFISEGNGIIELGEYQRTLLFADITISNETKNVGFKVKSNGQEYMMGIVKKDGKTYLAITRDDSLKDQEWVEILDNNQTTFKLKVILDENLVEIFVNDEYAVTANTLLKSNYEIDFVLEGKNTKAKSIKINKLADYKNIYD